MNESIFISDNRKKKRTELTTGVYITNFRCIFKSVTFGNSLWLHIRGKKLHPLWQNSDTFYRFFFALFFILYTPRNHWWFNSTNDLVFFFIFFKNKLTFQAISCICKTAFHIFCCFHHLRLDMRMKRKDRKKNIAN